MVGRIMPNFIEVRQGDSFTIQLQFKDENGFIDISGAYLKMQIKTGNDNKTLINKIGVIDDALKGKAHIAITPEDTKKISPNNDYITDIQITFKNGEVHTIYPQDINQVAKFIISQNVTE